MLEENLFHFIILESDIWRDFNEAAYRAVESDKTAYEGGGLLQTQPKEGPCGLDGSLCSTDCYLAMTTDTH